VTVLENTQIERLVESGGAATAVRLANGEELPLDLAIVGIGIAPNAELAEAAGLEVAVGVVVDDHGRTSDPAIYAAGDCTVLPFDNMPTRLESVQNAHDQAAAVAANICGADTVYDPHPWFWSDQYDMKLQIAGLNRGYDAVVVRPGKREGSVSHFYFRQGRFIAVDCLNDAATYAMSRKLLEAGATITPEQIADEAFDLRAAVKALYSVERSTTSTPSSTRSLGWVMTRVPSSTPDRISAIRPLRRPTSTGICRATPSSTGEQRPAAVIAEQRRDRHLQDVLSFPDDNAHEDGVAVAKPLAGDIAILEIDGHVDTLLLDAEGGDLGARPDRSRAQSACRVSSPPQRSTSTGAPFSMRTASEDRMSATISRLSGWPIDNSGVPACTGAR
jgi:hypothetical protein